MASAAKKTPKLKFISDDGEDLQFLKETPKPKKSLKRLSKNELCFEETSARKKKAEIPSDSNTYLRKRISELVTNQLEARKILNENVLVQLAEVTAQVEADYNALKENEQKLEQLTAYLMKRIQQSSNAYKQKLEALQDILISFKNE